MKLLRGAGIVPLSLFFMGLVASGIAGINESMRFGKAYVLCSPFNGQLVDNDGKTVAGVRIDREWKWGWNDSAGSDQTVTDSEGRFHLPRVAGRSFSAGSMSHQPLISQTINAHGPNGIVRIWLFIKKNYDENGEFDRQPARVICGIDKPPPGDVLYGGTSVLVK